MTPHGIEDDGGNGNERKSARGAARRHAPDTTGTVAEMMAICADTPAPEARADGSPDADPSPDADAAPETDAPSPTPATLWEMSDDALAPEPIEHPLARLPSITDHGDGLTGEIPAGVNRRLAAFLSWLLLPVYIVVGLRVRSRMLRMAPAQGPHRASLPGRGKPLRLLVVGDSSVAGVGVSHTSHGLAHRIAENLARMTGRPVIYVMHGANSAVAGQLRDYVVPHLPAEPFTHVVVSVGANDAKNFHSAKRWRRDFGTLLYALRTRYPEATIVWSRLFDFAKLPSIPRSLGLVLNLRRAIICRMADELCIERGAHAAPLMDITHEEGLSRDGFHASGLGYRMWGRHLAAFIASMEPSRGPMTETPRALVGPPAPLSEAVADETVTEEGATSDAVPAGAAA